MMLWKCCAQYASKFGKISSGHKTGKGQFSFQSQRSKSHSVMSDSLWPHGLYSPWNSLGQNTEVDSLSLLQEIFPTQGLNPGLLHCRCGFFTSWATREAQSQRKAIPQNVQITTQLHSSPGGSDGKASVYSVRDLGLIPGLGRFSGEGNGNPFQYSCLDYLLDRGT